MELYTGANSKMFIFIYKYENNFMSSFHSPLYYGLILPLLFSSITSVFPHVQIHLIQKCQHRYSGPLSYLLQTKLSLWSLKSLKSVTLPFKTSIVHHSSSPFPPHVIVHHQNLDPGTSSHHLQNPPKKQTTKTTSILHVPISCINFVPLFKMLCPYLEKKEDSIQKGATVKAYASHRG